MKKRLLSSTLLLAAFCFGVKGGFAQPSSEFKITASDGAADDRFRIFRLAQRGPGHRGGTWGRR